jgi:hypothetical protein
MVASGWNPSQIEKIQRAAAPKLVENRFSANRHIAGAPASVYGMGRESCEIACSYA